MPLASAAAAPVAPNVMVLPLMVRTSPATGPVAVADEPLVSALIRSVPVATAAEVPVCSTVPDVAAVSVLVAGVVAVPVSAARAPPSVSVADAAVTPPAVPS